MGADSSCCQARDCTVRLFGFNSLPIMGMIVSEKWGRHFCSIHGNQAAEVDRSLENAVLEMHTYALILSGLSHLTDHPTEFPDGVVSEIMADFKVARDRVKRLRAIEDDLLDE